MEREYLLEARRREGSEVYFVRGPSVKRLVCGEYLLHHAVDAAAHHEIDAGLPLQAIPVALHGTEYRLVDAKKILKLVDDQCERPRLGHL